ncbi:MAG TPA: serine/threonine-protein kinase, partial [Kofleriaceae bacterium]|nr:serine/threonine-protein kinase [Kofleriaceae bacterium]
MFGRYLLVQRLSRGGMGEIFLAKHGLAGFEKLAVIKKILPHLSADASFISRFVDEAQVAIKLSHVNVAQVFEVGRIGSEYFLALEFIDGRDLRRLLAKLGHRNERMPTDLALYIAREVANGLAYAHRRTTSDGAPLNLVHCDISPPNVLVSFEGETKVIDFGIAKSVMRATATDPRVGFGKFGYMAPEQLIRGGHVDHRTDIYAAGVVLFEALTGTRLYESGPEPNYRDLARKVTRGEHPLPSELEADLAPYDDLVATALRPKAEDRYQSAAELRDAIQQCLVAVNPTISTDQLGTYMRELFADEMIAHRELHDRIASAHLSDFQEQFHTQTISTVSFALAQLPLPPPPLTDAATATGPMVRPREATQQIIPWPRTTGPVAVVSRKTGPSPVVARPVTGRHVSLSRSGPAVRPSPALDTMTPPTDAIEPLEVVEPAVGPAAVPMMMMPPMPVSPSSGVIRTAAVHRHRGTVIAAGAGVVVIAILAAWGLSSSGPGPGPGPAAAPAPVQPPALPSQPAATGITVEPIEVTPDPSAPAGDPEIEMTPNDRPAAPPTAVPAAVPAAPPTAPMTDDGSAHPAGPSHRAPREVAHRPLHVDPKPPAAALTREQLGQKF